jgi:hypothetical protein
VTNHFLPSRYVEIIDDLAIGVEPVDAVLGSRVPPPLYMVRDSELAEDVRRQLGDDRRQVTFAFPKIRRTNTCRFRLRYRELDPEPAADMWVGVRLVQGFNELTPRHYVPRRFEIRLLRRQPLDPAIPDPNAPATRIHRPALFPGADYPVHDSATCIRGRVLRGGRPMPWARIEARRPLGPSVVVGRAHGDDRGEFLLLLNTAAASLGGAGMYVTVRVTVFGPNPALAPPPTSESAIDVQWDLPIERLPFSAASSNAVARGEELPPNYTAQTWRDVTVRVGVVSSALDPFVIT